MKKLLIVLCLAFCSPGLAQSPAGKKKNRLNTNLYEQESTESSISGKVKTVREIQGETEVFLDNSQGKGGPFVLPQNIPSRAKLLNTLKKSQKAGGPAVTLRVDEQQIIKSLEESENSVQAQPDIDF